MARTKVKHNTDRVGTNIVGDLATRLIRLKTKTGISARRINEIMLLEFLPEIEEGRAKFEMDSAGVRLVRAA